MLKGKQVGFTSKTFGQASSTSPVVSAHRDGRAEAAQWAVAKRWRSELFSSRSSSSRSKHKVCLSTVKQAQEAVEKERPEVWYSCEVDREPRHADRAALVARLGHSGVRTGSDRR